MQRPAILFLTAALLVLVADPGPVVAQLSPDGDSSLNGWVTKSAGTLDTRSVSAETLFSRALSGSGEDASPFSVRELELGQGFSASAAGDEGTGSGDLRGAAVSGTNLVGVPAEVVPEPATMILLASGLLGLAGVGVLRRRGQDGVEQH